MCEDTAPSITGETVKHQLDVGDAYRGAVHSSHLPSLKHRLGGQSFHVSCTIPSMYPFPRCVRLGVSIKVKYLCTKPFVSYSSISSVQVMFRSCLGQTPGYQCSNPT